MIILRVGRWTFVCLYRQSLGPRSLLCHSEYSLPEVYFRFAEYLRPWIPSPSGVLWGFVRDSRRQLSVDPSSYRSNQQALRLTRVLSPNILGHNPLSTIL